jgi:phenylacetic acid degradation protein
MPLYEFEGKRPKVAPSAFVSPSSVVIGDVEIGEECYIASNCVIRGDWGKIVIGDQSNVQDGCVIHVRPDEQTIIGRRVSIGHASVVHNATIKDFALVGMNAVISDWAVVGEYSVIGEGCVVRHNQVIEPKSIAVGIPAKVVGKLTQEQLDRYEGYKTLYAGLPARCHKSLRRIDT